MNGSLFLSFSFSCLYILSRLCICRAASGELIWMAIDPLCRKDTFKVLLLQEQRNAQYRQRRRFISVSFFLVKSCQQPSESSSFFSSSCNSLQRKSSRIELCVKLLLHELIMNQFTKAAFLSFPSLYTLFSRLLLFTIIRPGYSRCSALFPRLRRNQLKEERSVLLQELIRDLI